MTHPRRYQMITSTIVRRPLLAAGLATVCLALGAAASLAASPNAPFVGTFYDQEAVSDTVAGDYPCFAGVTGTITGTDTVSGRFNNAPDFFHFEGTETFDYRIDFSDGRYVIGELGAHFTETANAESGIVRQKDSGASQERATVYAADGSATGAVTISGTFHTSWADLNDNHQVDPGEITASVDRLKVTCP
jgi:hypothetical protein